MVANSLWSRLGTDATVNIENERAQIGTPITITIATCSTFTDISVVVALLNLVEVNHQQISHPRKKRDEDTSIEYI
jgi:hypothetical protein